MNEMHINNKIININVIIKQAIKNIKMTILNNIKSIKDEIIFIKKNNLNNHFLIKYFF